MNDRETLKKYVYGELMPTPQDDWPADDANLFELGLDSLRVMRLLVFVENEIGVRIPDEEITPERLQSIDALVELIGQSRVA